MEEVKEGRVVMMAEKRDVVATEAEIAAGHQVEVAMGLADA